MSSLRLALGDDGTRHRAERFPRRRLTKQRLRRCHAPALLVPSAMEWSSQKAGWLTPLADERRRPAAPVETAHREGLHRHHELDSARRHRHVDHDHYTGPPSPDARAVSLVVDEVIAATTNYHAPYHGSAQQPRLRETTRAGLRLFERWLSCRSAQRNKAFSVEASFSERILRT